MNYITILQLHEGFGSFNIIISVRFFYKLMPASVAQLDSTPAEVGNILS